MANHGDILYTDGGGVTHYSDGTTSYVMGGPTFYSDGSTSHQIDHTILHSDGSHSFNNNSFADAATDLMFNNQTNSQSVNTSQPVNYSSGSDWVRTAKPYHVPIIERIFSKIGIIIGAFFSGCLFAIYITIGIVVISVFTGSFSVFNDIFSTYTTIAIVLGIIMVIISLLTSDD